MLIYSGELFPTDYTVYRKDHPDGYRGEFMACRESHASYRLDLTVCSYGHVVCEIKLADNTSLIVCSIYRPPSTEGNWKQWKWKLETENGNGKRKRSKLDANES